MQALGDLQASRGQWTAYNGGKELEIRGAKGRARYAAEERKEGEGGEGGGTRLVQEAG